VAQLEEMFDQYQTDVKAYKALQEEANDVTAKV
jgi:hypothetical protein